MYATIYKVICVSSTIYKVDVVVLEHLRESPGEVYRDVLVRGDPQS